MIRSTATRRRRVRAVGILAGLGVVTLMAALSPHAALQAHAGSTPTHADSTPVPIAAPEGELMSYVINTRTLSAAQMRDVARAVADANGDVVQTWPEIGVIVAHSRSTAFRSTMVSLAQGAMSSIGATRTTAVSEGTPAGDADLRAVGGAANRHAAWAPANGDVAAPRTPATSVDPLESQQWDLARIHAPEAHRVTDGSPNVLVGVLDGGIDPDHPDLVDRISVADSVNCTDAGRPDTSASGWHATNSDHGTHVAGTIAAARNGVGIVGVAPAVRVASVKVVNDDGLIYPEYAVCGFMWAARSGMDLTNNSYFVDPFMFLCSDQPDQAAALQAVRRAVAWAETSGVVTVAAAGNESTDLTTITSDTTSPNDSTPVSRVVDPSCLTVPAELSDVIAVSSTASDGTLSSFSNTGEGVIDVAAPGSDILSSVGENDGWATMSGTSMAAPHVAGVVALMKSEHADWAPARIREEIQKTAVDVACPVAGSTASAAAPACDGDAARNSWFGEGVVDALAAVG